ncbi:Probable aspartic protease At2g35615 [Linum perenne]
MEPTKALMITTIFILLAQYSHGFKITTQLIHRDSIFSPFYNGSETTADRAKRATESSLARHALLSSSSKSVNGIEAGLIPSTNHGLIFVKFSIGDPPVPQLAVMDTGSPLTWVNCLPCTPCFPSISTFEPAKSKTYKPLPCTEDCVSCDRKVWPWSVSKCLYTTEYYRHSIRSEGEKATEQLTFRTYNDSTTVIPNVTFGCSHLMTGLEDPDQRLTGVLGLAVEMTLRKGVILDTGSTLSYLYTEAFDVMKAKIRKLAGRILQEVPPLLYKPYELCYRGVAERDAQGFPLLGFHFLESTSLELDRFGTFIQVKDDVFCLAVVRSPDVTIFGMNAQQGYNSLLFLQSCLQQQASIIITIFLFYSINSLTHSHGLKIKTRLIHRDSVHSPLYNASETITDRAKRAVQSSLARHAHLSLIDIPPGIEAGLVLATKINLFHVNFSIGQPPVPQLAILDTGSELVWVKCLPCNLCKPTRGETVFDPLKSKTYVPRPCTKSCDNCTGEWPRRYCSYEIYYEGGDQSEGIYATDQLTFSTSDDGLVTIPDIQFGCSSLLTGPNILNISDQVFKKMSKQGIMVDSGTDVMILHDEAFEVVMAEIKKIAASSNLTEVLEREDYELCYKGLVNVDARDQFQNMDLQFKDGADLLIDNTGMFIQVDDDTFCLAVLRTMGVSIIGVMAQQGYNVGRCKFTVTYYDSRVSEGIYVTDQLTFLPSGDYKAKVTVRNILLGCSSYFTARDEELDNHFNGVIGLGPYSDSEIELVYPNLISVLGSKFSYCTGRLHDRSYPYNQASFGGNAVLVGR